MTVIIRNAGFRRDAGKWARDCFGDLGSAGGQKSMARAEIPLEHITALLNEKSPDMQKFVLDRIKKVASYLI